MVDLDNDAARGATSGAGVIDSVRATSAAIQDEDWGEFAASAGVLALDGLAMAVDPVGTLLAAGVGWLIEHIGPLTEALDKLAGDPGAIQAGADNWTAVQRELEAIARDVPGTVQGDLAGWSGDARDAYDARSKDMALGIEALSTSAGSAAAVVATAGTMVGTCRAIVRDIVSAVIAELIKGALAALAGSVISFGATVAGYITYAVGRIGMTVAKIASKISSLLAKLGKAGAHLAKVLDDIAAVGAKIGSGLGKAGGAVGKVSPGAGTSISSVGESLGRGASRVDNVAASVGRGADRVTGVADDLGGFAARTGDTAAQRMGRGRDLIDNADDLGRRASEAIKNGPVPDGGFREFGEKVGLVNEGFKPNPVGIGARGIAYEPQSHEQNDAEDIEEGNAGARYNQYDGYNRHGEPVDSPDGYYDGTRRP
ncbi:WXG100 family type VII secretion target [Amycolatopsis aidingensis]|uniref:WXG100 family type VII secretion target n=1 Tax=Amycolatopsis aidingensis TaxID=2842453 RepID=UPI001C0CDFF1|nr:hypothetical protein [Amycolatopsis aidingensis]